MVYQRTVVNFVSDYLAPGICYLCEGVSGGQSLLCKHCLRDLPRNLTACMRCGAPDSAGPVCNRCLDAPGVIDQTIAPLLYQFPVDKLIHEFKYQQKIILAKEFGALMADSILKVSTSLPECLLPIPLHPRRYVWRGFNQAHEIAKAVAASLSISIDDNLLARDRNTLPQPDLNKRERKQNMRGAFTLSAAPTYACVAIIDDVITTGATIMEAASVLKKAGVKHVFAWACAKAFL